MNPDSINGMWIFLAGLFILNNCRVAFNAKGVAGVSVISTTFFAIWPIWQLYYYLSIDQGDSLLGTCILAFASWLWVGILIKNRYSK